MAVKKKRTTKKAPIRHRDTVKKHKENREQFGMATNVSNAYQIIHDALMLLESGDDQVYPPEELIEQYFTMFNFVAKKKDGANNFEALKVGIAFEKQLDDLTSLLKGMQVVSSNRKDALDSAIKAVSQYFPIDRRNEVKEQTAKSRTASKKKVVSKKAVSKKTVSKKKVVAKSGEDQVTKTRGRKAAGFVVFNGATVDTNASEDKLFSDGKELDWDAFDGALKKGRVKPSTTVGFKDSENNVFANIIKAIGGNRGKAVPAKNVVAFVVENVELSENVAKRKLYKLLNDKQLDVV